MILTAYTDPGLRHGENQDYYLAGRLADDTYWAVLCDGMGGGADGGAASRLTAETFRREIAERVPDILSEAGIEEFLDRTVRQCNRMILERSSGDPENPVTMGTTVVCAIVRDGVAEIIHAGDSRAYHITKKGIKQITKDHSIVQELLDCGKITPEQARIHPNKNIITSAVGVDGEIKADKNRVKLAGGDMLLLCSDGLSNMLEDRDLELMAKAEDFYGSAEAMVKKAVEAGGYDNITAVLLKA